MPDTNACCNCNLVPDGCADCMDALSEPVEVFLIIKPRRPGIICTACGAKTEDLVIICPECKQKIPPGSIQ